MGPLSRYRCFVLARWWMQWWNEEQLEDRKGRSKRRVVRWRRMSWEMKFNGEEMAYWRKHTVVECCANDTPPQFVNKSNKARPSTVHPIIRSSLRLTPSSPQIDSSSWLQSYVWKCRYLPRLLWVLIVFVEQSIGLRSKSFDPTRWKYQRFDSLWYDA